MNLTPHPSPSSGEGRSKAGLPLSTTLERTPGGEAFLAVVALVFAVSVSLAPAARAEDAPPWWQKLRWTWAAAGLAAGSATAAVFAGVHAAELEDRYRGALAASRETPQPAAAVLGLGDRAHGQAELSNVLWGVAGVWVITGGVLAWLELTTPDDAGRVYVAPAPLPGGAALGLGGRF